MLHILNIKSFSDGHEIKIGPFLLEERDNMGNGRSYFIIFSLITVEHNMLIGDPESVKVPASLLQLASPCFA